LKEVKTNLKCSWCFEESGVKVIYEGNKPVKLVCENCGRVITLSSVPSHPSWKLRILTKPLRLAREASQHPVYFTSTLPFRLLIKPLRIMRELEKSLK